MEQFINKIKHKLPLHGIILLLIPLLMLPLMPPQDMAKKAHAGNEVRLPILMYHQLTKEPSRVCDHCITARQFESDLDELIKLGYTTVSMAQVIAFCELGTPLPPKPIVISFDDGFEAFYVYGFPMLKQRGMKAVLAVIGEETERFTQTEDRRLKYSSSTWPQLKEMSDSGLVEIESHSWNLHSKKGGRLGAMKKNCESTEEYLALLTNDVEKMRTEFKNNGLPDFSVYVYPYGRFSSETSEILSSLGVRAIFLCDSRVNVLRAGDTDVLMRLKRFNRAPGTFYFDDNVLLAVR